MLTESSWPACGRRYGTQVRQTGTTSLQKHAARSFRPPHRSRPPRPSRASLCPPNTGDKLRGARTPRPVDGDSATAVPADYHASLQLLPRLVSFIALFACLSDPP